MAGQFFIECSNIRYHQKQCIRLLVLSRVWTATQMNRLIVTGAKKSCELA
jgi:hypothetical protein